MPKDKNKEESKPKGKEAPTVKATKKRKVVKGGAANGK